MSATDLRRRDLRPTWTRPAACESRWVAIGCRAIDIVLSALMLIALAPVFLALAIAIRRDSPGKALFRQERLGRDLQPFTIYKFRTMRTDADHARHKEYVLGLINGGGPEQTDNGAIYKMVGDDRITRVGAFLRRSSLDELPQILNVLKGEMSLVGPRPPIPYEVDFYPPHWFARFAVKPGLTGLWQVSGRSTLTHEQMIELDIEYTRTISPWLNCKILVRTIPVVVKARDAA